MANIFADGEELATKKMISALLPSNEIKLIDDNFDLNNLQEPAYSSGKKPKNAPADNFQWARYWNIQIDTYNKIQIAVNCFNQIATRGFSGSGWTAWNFIGGGTK